MAGSAGGVSPVVRSNSPRLSGLAPCWCTLDTPSRLTNGETCKAILVADGWSRSLTTPGSLLRSPYLQDLRLQIAWLQHSDRSHVFQSPDADSTNMTKGGPAGMGWTSHERSDTRSRMANPYSRWRERKGGWVPGGWWSLMVFAEADMKYGLGRTVGGRSARSD